MLVLLAERKVVVETMLGEVEGARFFDECAADPERFADDTRIFAQKIVRATRACVVFLQLHFLALRRAVDLAGRVNWWRLLQALSIRQ